MNNSLVIAFGAFHTLLGLSVFAFVAWLMLGEGGDDHEGTDDGGGGGGGGGSFRPRPWRPGPGRPRMRKGPSRVRETTRLRGPAVRTQRSHRALR